MKYKNIQRQLDLQVQYNNNLTLISNETLQHLNDNLTQPHGPQGKEKIQCLILTLGSFGEC